MPLRSHLQRVGPVVGMLALLGVMPETAVAQEAAALTVATMAAYDVAPSEGRVDVQFSYVLENRTDGVAFPGFFESLPVDAGEVAAAGARQELEVSLVGTDAGFAVWFVAFDDDLDPGEATTVTLDWVLFHDEVDGPIVEPGAVSIDVYVPGPAGATWQPATVELPEGFVPIEPATTEQAGVEEGRVKFSAPTDEPYAVQRFGYVSRERFVESEIDAPPLLTIADWSPEGAWAGAVRERVSTVAATLDRWFGPRLEPFEVRRGLAADGHPPVLLTTDDPVVVVDDAAAVSIDHQLAHAWMADVPVEEDWFVEGLAAAFAGGDPVPLDPAAIVLPIADEIGPRGVHSVIAALRAADITYPKIEPGIEPEIQPLPPDWRTLLDLLEGVGGATDAAAAFRESAVDAVGAAAIDRRAAALVDYRALESRAGTWSLPPFLRFAMAEWDFDSFAEQQGAVSDTVLQRDNLEAWAVELGLDPLDDAQRLFESAGTDMAAVDALLVRRQAALDAFAEAQRLVNGDRGLLARVGLLGQDPDGDLAQLRERWAAGDYAGVEHRGHELAELVEGAVGAGTVRLLVPAVIVVAFWQLIRRTRRNRSARAQAPSS